MSNLTKKLGRAIKKKRKELEITQEELAKRANMHRTYIGMVERGEKNITILNAKKLAKALNISLSTLLKKIEN